MIWELLHLKEITQNPKDFDTITNDTRIVIKSILNLISEMKKEI